MFDRDRLLAELAAEEVALNAALARYSDERMRSVQRADGWSVHDIAAHLADSTYGLARIVLGEIPVGLPTDGQSGWMQADEHNRQRREKNATLSRDKLGERLVGAFAAARRAIEAEQIPETPGPTGAQFTRGDWLQRMVGHLQEHRAEIEVLA